MAYSGLPSLAKEAQEKITKKLSDADDPFSDDLLTVEQIKEFAESTLMEMYQQHGGRLDLQMLIACEVLLKLPELWKFSDGAFYSVDEFEVLGIGDSSLIRYLEQMYSIKDDLETGEKLALFLIEKAKNFIDGCGGETDILTIPYSAPNYWLDKKAIQEITKEMKTKEKDLLRKIIAP